MEDKRIDPMGSDDARGGGKGQPSVHRRFLDAHEVGGVLAMVRDCGAWWAVTCCLIFMALTCVRSREAMGATWDEIDFGTAVWTIPANRTKGGVPHRVPLSVQALKVLDYVRKQGGGQGLVFPSRRGGKVMGSGMPSLISRRLETPAVRRGFRPSFMSWAIGRADIPVLATQMILYQARSYTVLQEHETSDHFEQRQRVMQEWADFLTRTMGPVVPADANRR